MVVCCVLFAAANAVGIQFAAREAFGPVWPSTMLLMSVICACVGVGVLIASIALRLDVTATIASAAMVMGTGMLYYWAAHAAAAAV